LFFWLAEEVKHIAENSATEKGATIPQRMGSRKPLPGETFLPAWQAEVLDARIIF
jgi:hypothetical protein